MQEVKNMEKKKLSKYERLKKLRTKLYNVNPFCSECDVKMILPEEVGYKIYRNGGIKNIKEHPDNLCTLTHTLSIFDPQRQENRVNKRILLCLKCSGKKGMELTNNHLTIEEQRKRSGSAPLSEIKWDNIQYNYVNSALQHRLLNNKIYNRISFGKLAKEISEETMVDFMITKAILLQHNDIKVEDGKILINS